jgi:uncharacterized membrane protein YfcA
MDEASKPTTHQHLTRRQFLVRSALVGSAGLVVGGVGGVVLARFLPSAFPSKVIGNVVQ